MQVPKLGSLFVNKKALESRAFFCCIYSSNLEKSLVKLEDFHRVSLFNENNEFLFGNTKLSELATQVFQYRLLGHKKILFYADEKRWGDLSHDQRSTLLKLVPRLLFIGYNPIGSLIDLAPNLKKEIEVGICSENGMFLEGLTGISIQLLSNPQQIKDWVDFQYLLSNPPSRAFTFYKYFMILVLVLPILLMFLVLPHKSGVEFKKLKINEEESLSVLDSNCVTQVNIRPDEFRRIYQYSLYAKKIFMPSDSEIEKALKKHFPNVDSLNLFSSTKKKDICIEYPTDLETYESQDYESYKKMTALILDTMAYPTDYWWDGAESLHRRHEGVDLGAKAGATILSPMSGLAKVIEGGPGGRMLGIERDSLVVYFAHIDKYLVFAGDSVKKGEPLASIGLTGRTTGPHLHLMTGKIKKNIRHWQNPITWFKENEDHLE